MNHYFQSEINEKDFNLSESTVDHSYHPSLVDDVFANEEKQTSNNFLTRFFGLEIRHKNKANTKKAKDVDLGLNHIYLALNRAYKNRDFLEVSVPGDSTKYQSILLKLDPDEKTVLVDELFPRTFIGLPGQKMRFSLRQTNGRSIVFDANIMERHEFDGSPVYVIAMPESLNESQRRLAFRMNVPEEITINSSFIAPDEQAYAARICDVSSSGVCIEAHGEITKVLRAGDLLKKTSFNFEGVNVVCDLTVKNLVDKKVEKDDSSKDSSLKALVSGKKRIGAKFNNLPASARRQLEKSIMQLQREQLRGASQSQNFLLS